MKLNFWQLLGAALLVLGVVLVYRNMQSEKKPVKQDSPPANVQPAPQQPAPTPVVPPATRPATNPS